MTIVERALELVTVGSVVGLGTGRAATAFIAALGERVRSGLRIRGVPTSQASESLARQVGIPLATLAEVEYLDLAFDGADEVDPAGDLIKGYGGALVREKIVATAARRFIVLVGAEKLVPQLGTRGRLPIEVVPFAVPSVGRALFRRGYAAALRPGVAGAYVTDNGNHILDVAVTPISGAGELDRQLRDLPGVVGTGFFLALADLVLVQDGDRVTEIVRSVQHA